MLDKLAAVVLWTKFIIPIAIFLFVLVALILYVVIWQAKYDKKIKILKNAGYTRYLNGVSSFGGHSTYGWQKKNSRILECTIEHMKVKRWKEWIKNEMEKNT